MKIGSTDKLLKYSTIESIVELEIQEDDVNKANEIDEERKRYKTLKNTKLPVKNKYLEDITNKRMLSDNFTHGFNILCRRQFENVCRTSRYLPWSNIPFSSGQINDFVKEQIYALMQPDVDVLKINIMPVHQQTNSVDCGTFAMAF